MHEIGKAAYFLIPRQNVTSVPIYSTSNVEDALWLCPTTKGMHMGIMADGGGQHQCLRSDMYTDAGM